MLIEKIYILILLDFKPEKLQHLINIVKVQKEFKFEVIKSSNTEIIIAVGVAAFVVIALVVVMAVRHVHNSRDTGKGWLLFTFRRIHMKPSGLLTPINTDNIPMRHAEDNPLLPDVSFILRRSVIESIHEIILFLESNIPAKILWNNSRNFTRRI